MQTALEPALIKEDGFLRKPFECGAAFDGQAGLEAAECGVLRPLNALGRLRGDCDPRFRACGDVDIEAVAPCDPTGCVDQGDRELRPIVAGKEAFERTCHMESIEMRRSITVFGRDCRASDCARGRRGTAPYGEGLVDWSLLLIRSDQSFGKGGRSDDIFGSLRTGAAARCANIQQKLHICSQFRRSENPASAILGRLAGWGGNLASRIVPQRKLVSRKIGVKFIFDEIQGARKG